MTLKNQIQTDLNNTFFNTSEFADVAIINGGAVNGQFDNDYYGSEFESIEVQGKQSSFTCATSDVPNIKKNTAVRVCGSDYLVTKPEPDGTGVTVLVLQRA